jgi:RNA polymerase sigma factor (sigma-70 family)
MDGSGARTSPTLLGRLRTAPTDQTAWGEFVDRYGPRIYAWCRRWQLQEADAQDVTQNVLLRLAEKMHGFDYDRARSFRGWLRTLTHHAWCDFVSGRQAAGGGSQLLEVLHRVEAREDLQGRLEEELDRELLAEAMARVRLRVEPHTWEAFELLAVQGCSGAEAASRLGMKVATVFVARSKVNKMIREEMSRLDSPDP